MIERPILFSAPMIRALLAGTKTQTRRVVRFPAHLVPYHPHANVAVRTGGPHEQFLICSFGVEQTGAAAITCPYGVPGDRLWVREAFCSVESNVAFSSRPGLPTGGALPWVAYRADGGGDAAPFGRWRPSIHMPRWASRISLELTGVRVERLHDISEADAKAEGVLHEMFYATSAREHFSRLWDVLNAKRGAGWDLNPFVWALDFRCVTSSLHRHRVEG